MAKIQKFVWEYLGPLPEAKKEWSSQLKHPTPPPQCIARYPTAAYYVEKLPPQRVIPFQAYHS